jgi:hypothetical protein
MIETLGQFLAAMDVRSRFFDMGHHIREISDTTFARFEQQQICFPNPYLRAAWIGVLFWQEGEEQSPQLWFLKFPLDEQAKIDLPERDRFLQQLMTAVGANLQAIKEGEQLKAVLEGNPFSFKPAPERQAYLHAYLNHHLGKPNSQYYQAACDYLSGDLSQWQQIGVQGLAEVAVNWQKHQNELQSALASMPAQPAITLCHCLEQEVINGALAKVMSKRIETLIEDSDSASLTAALLRGMSSSSALELRSRTLGLILSATAADSIEVLAAIAGRCQLDLMQPEICQRFLEALAKQPQQNFNQLMSELLFIPMLRNHLLQQFRSPDRSEQLSLAIGNLLHPDPPQVH